MIGDFRKKGIYRNYHELIKLRVDKDDSKALIKEASPWYDIFHCGIYATQELIKECKDQNYFEDKAFNYIFDNFKDKKREVKKDISKIEKEVIVKK